MSTIRDPGGAKGGRATRKTGLPTMREVARRAGVSAITVSRALREPRRVRAETLERVRRAIEATGFVANPVAGSLAGATSRVVAVVVPNIRNAFFSSTIEAIGRRLAPAGYQLFVGSTGYVARTETDLIRSFLVWHPAAIVVTGVEHAPEAERLLRGAGVPVVETWDRSANPLDLVVGFSHYEVGREVARFLIGRGYRRLGSIGCHLGRDRRARRRLRGFEETARRAGLAVESVALPEPARVERGGTALGMLLDRAPALEAVFCANDVLALGALLECQRRGVRVPRDLALVGFGDLDFAGQTVPPLTTVRPPGEAIGERAAELILAREAGGAPLPRVHDLGFALVERGSTAAPGEWATTARAAAQSAKPPAAAQTAMPRGVGAKRRPARV